jgi:hypothetical protein
MREAAVEKNEKERDTQTRKKGNGMSFPSSPPHFLTLTLSYLMAFIANL